MRKLHVWLTKEEIIPAELEGNTAVVMDVFLATTTMLTMMEQGAAHVFPVASMAEANEKYRTSKSKKIFRGGEEKGVKIPEFELGPLPEEYQRAHIAGGDVIFLTTNGTRAIRAAATAKKLLIASLRNAQKMANYLLQYAEGDIFLICAGANGQLSMEDTLCAGFIANQFPQRDWALNDAGLFVRGAFSSMLQDLHYWLSQGRVGRWFTREHLEKVVEFVGDIGASNSIVEVVSGELRFVPFFDENKVDA